MPTGKVLELLPDVTVSASDVVPFVQEAIDELLEIAANMAHMCYQMYATTKSGKLMLR